ncbi:hypothetical protein TcWFU_007251 [Taenia crassiceps]|uniref:Uncharacterized protein n=1 Tax=Taenia crassiceps TaxID=6207 RepID=A0ABR4Q858_9CEST
MCPRRNDTPFDHLASPLLASTRLSSLLLHLAHGRGEEVSTEKHGNERVYGIARYAMESAIFSTLGSSISCLPEIPTSQRVDMTATHH